MFTVEQQNRLRILKEVTDRAFQRLVSTSRKRGVPKPGAVRTVRDNASKIDDLFTSISALQRPPKSLKDIGKAHGEIIATLLLYWYTGTAQRDRVVEGILSDLYANAAQYDLEAVMPRPRRTRKPSRPMTRVERNAQNVFDKVKVWERKARLAKTKLAKYRAKAKRYQNKGVLANA